MSPRNVPRWMVQSAFAVALVAGLGFALGAAVPSPSAAASPLQAQATGVSPKGGCEPGFSGSPDTKCEDVNECAVGNGGCHRLTGCENTPGSRTCGGCPKDYAGDGYVGCFDVNECANPDCSDRLPSGADDTPPPVVSTSGDVTVAATSAKGAAATFTATAKDNVDGTRPVSCTPASGSMFGVGKTTVTCWAFNKRGKIGRATLAVTVNQ
jgi:HYR domain